MLHTEGPDNGVHIPELVSPGEVTLPLILSSRPDKRPHGPDPAKGLAHLFFDFVRRSGQPGGAAGGPRYTRARPDTPAHPRTSQGCEMTFMSVGGAGRWVGYVVALHSVPHGDLIQLVPVRPSDWEAYTEMK